MTNLHTAAQQDIPDLIAGALGVSRGTAYDFMREALAQERSSDEQPAPVQEPVAWVEKNGDLVWQNYKAAIGRNLYINPPAQKFVCSTGLCHFTLTQTNVGIGERGMEAYEAAKKRGWVGLSDERLMEMPKQEPVDWEAVAADQAMTIVMMKTELAAQRQWHGLTDEEILKLAYPIRWQEVDDFEADKAVNFAQAIEAKLKEKNSD